MFEPFIDFTQGLPTWAQWLGIMLISAIPFIESYFGSVIGVLIGVPPFIAIAAAIVGNGLSMVLVVLLGHAARRRVAKGRPEAEPSPKRQRLKRTFDRFGVPGVSMLGQTILPSQITAGAMVSFGASRNAVIIWQCISIVVWGVAFGLLAMAGVNLLGLRG